MASIESEILRFLSNDAGTPPPSCPQEYAQYAASIFRKLRQSEKLQREFSELMQLQENIFWKTGGNMQFGNVTVNSRNLPAEQVSGDGYDVFLDSANAVWMLMADSAGHGPAPAFFTQHVLAILRRFSEIFLAEMGMHADFTSLPVLAMHATARELAKLSDSPTSDRMFASAIALRIDSDRNLAWSSAGIHPWILDSRGNRITPDHNQKKSSSNVDRKIRDLHHKHPIHQQRDPRKSPALNLRRISSVSFPLYHTKLYSGDRIFLCSDGVTDLWDPIHFGSLLQHLSLKRISSSKICETLLQFPDCDMDSKTLEFQQNAQQTLIQDPDDRTAMIAEIA